MESEGLFGEWQPGVVEDAAEEDVLSEAEPAALPSGSPPANATASAEHEATAAEMLRFRSMGLVPGYQPRQARNMWAYRSVRDMSRRARSRSPPTAHDDPENSEPCSLCDYRISVAGRHGDAGGEDVFAQMHRMYDKYKFRMSHRDVCRLVLAYYHDRVLAPFEAARHAGTLFSDDFADGAECRPPEITQQQCEHHFTNRPDGCILDVSRDYEDGRLEALEALRALEPFAFQCRAPNPNAPPRPAPRNDDSDDDGSSASATPSVVEPTGRPDDLLPNPVVLRMKRQFRKDVTDYSERIAAAERAALLPDTGPQAGPKAPVARGGKKRATNTRSSGRA